MDNADVLLVEYWCADAFTLAFGARAGWAEPQVLQIPRSLQQIRDFVVEHMSGRTPTPGSLGSKLHQLRAFYDPEWREFAAPFVDPIRTWANDGDLLWLVPHDMLHYLPLHALEKDNRPLITRHPVVYTPSASVMKYCQAKRTRRGREVAVVFGDSHDDLPFAREEARLVAERFKTHAIVGRQATKSCLMGEIRALGVQLDVVHLACHGHFDPAHPLESGIMLAAGGDTPPSLTVQEIFGLELDVDLVVLSACDSGVNDRRPGDELIGLTRALIYSGARSVLVSLWPADDVSTLILMDDFYRQLSLDSSKAEALRHAQCHLLGLEEEETRAYVNARVEHLKRSGHAAHAKRLEQLARDSLVEAEEFNPRPLHGQPWHPYSGAAWWAPFILVGDWR